MKLARLQFSLRGAVCACLAAGVMLWMNLVPTETRVGRSGRLLQYGWPAPVYSEAYSEDEKYNEGALILEGFTKRWPTSIAVNSSIFLAIVVLAGWLEGAAMESQRLRQN